MDINADLFQWFTIYLIKKTSGSGIIQNQELVREYTSQLLENLENEEYTHLLKIIFGMLIWQICS